MLEQSFDTRPIPWSKRASVSPRKTYSAESKIVYKRRKHNMTMVDAQRIMDKILRENSTIGTAETKGLRKFYEEFLRWIQRATVKIIEEMLPYGFDWTAQPMYDFVYKTLSVLTADMNLTAEDKIALRDSLDRFLSELAKGLLIK